jgi:hypothetical protein
MPPTKARGMCSSCDKRRQIVANFHVGSVVLGLLFPVCRQCRDAGWKPQEGRDYVRA